MAVQIFDKAGNVSYIEPEALKRHLAAGYVLDNPNIPKQDINHPPTFYPKALSDIEKLPAQEAEKKVLAEMGIIEIVNPVSTPPVYVTPTTPPPALQTRKKQTTIKKPARKKK